MKSRQRKKPQEPTTIEIVVSQVSYGFWVGLGLFAAGWLLRSLVQFTSYDRMI